MRFSLVSLLFLEGVSYPTVEDTVNIRGAFNKFPDIFCTGI